MDGKENKYRFVRYIEQLEGKNIAAIGTEHGAHQLRIRIPGRCQRKMTLQLLFMKV